MYGRGASDASIVGWGPTVAFNVLDCDGKPVSYREVERMCGLRGVCLRGGTFCNPGAAARAFGLTAEMVKEAHRVRKSAGPAQPPAPNCSENPHLVSLGCPLTPAAVRLASRKQAGRICGDGGAHPNGTPLGAVRASFGLSSSLSVRSAETASPHLQKMLSSGRDFGRP